MSHEKIIIQEKKELTFQEKIDEISKNVKLDEIKKLFLRDLHDYSLGAIFFFDNQGIEYITIDDVYYYSFETFYYNRYYKNLLATKNLNCIRDVQLLKKIIIHLAKNNNNSINNLDFFEILNKYLKIKIKTCYRIIATMIEKLNQSSDLDYIDKYLIYFISQNFVIRD